MTTALLQDPVGKGGIATVVGWYRLWMERHQPDFVEVFLDEHGPSGWRELRQWSGGAAAVPRVLPRLHLPPYRCAARRLDAVGVASGCDVHVIGASVAHGTLLPGRKAIVWFATLFDDERRSSMQGRSLSRRLLYATTLGSLTRLERRVLGDADRVLAMSYHTADLVIERGLAPSSAVSVVPVPVDISIYQPPPEDNVRKGVLFVGRAYDPRKGFARLLALNEASKVVQRRGITVVSPGTAPSPLPDGMNWVGRVENLTLIYQQNELLVLPSRQEGLGIVAFEALACGTPVVAWRCGGPDRFLEQSGGGVVVNNPSELKRVVEDLINDPSRRREMGSAGRRYVEQHFSSDRFLDDPMVFKTI